MTSSACTTREIHRDVSVYLDRALNSCSPETLSLLLVNNDNVLKLLLTVFKFPFE